MALSLSLSSIAIYSIIAITPRAVAPSPSCNPFSPAVRQHSTVLYTCWIVPLDLMQVILSIINPISMFIPSQVHISMALVIET